MNIFAEFLREWKTVGAVAPTSSFARRAMLDQLDLAGVRVAVEFGPGTGVITQAILDRLHPEGRLIAVEINEHFCDLLRKRIDDPRLVVVQDSAENLPHILQSHGCEEADCVISSVPFANLPSQLRHNITQAAYDGLKAGGTVVCLQYTPWVLPKILRRTFGGFRIDTCLLNMPPAIIFSAAKT